MVLELFLAPVDKKMKVMLIFKIIEIQNAAKDCKSPEAIDNCSLLNFLSAGVGVHQKLMVFAKNCWNEFVANC